ncbi:MAG: hypothetical protein ACRD4O_08280 [Bryobacteraceae bacterium]
MAVFERVRKLSGRGKTPPGKGGGSQEWLTPRMAYCAPRLSSMALTVWKMM